MDARQSLLVQCPEVATELNYTLLDVPSNTTPMLFAADALRKSFMVAYTDANPVYISTNLADAASEQGFALLNTFTTSVFNVPWLKMNDAGEWPQQAWYVANPSATDVKISVWEELYTCRAIILGINTGVQNTDGPAGPAPIGIWTSPNLDGGPAIFKLARHLDHDMTIYEWFAYPVGIGSISIQVFQAFELLDLDTDAMQGKIKVGLPQLSPAAKRHLHDLRSRLNGKKEPPHALPNHTP
jgi:hypothetical protein